MTDITSTHLEAAIIDQKIAGAFAGKRYAFTAVIEDGYMLGVAVADEPGYSPIIGKTFESWDEAKVWANGLNQHIGLKFSEAMDIITSTMRGSQAVRP
jgi:hypothetical protein